MVSQVLIVAVQNSVDRRGLGIAMATANFFRGPGGAAGAAILGAVFAARAGPVAVADGPAALGTAARAEVIDAVQTVFIVAAPLAALALVTVLALREIPLRSEEPPGGSRTKDRPTHPDAKPALASGLR